MRFFLPSLFSSISIEPGLTINFEIFALMTASCCLLPQQPPGALDPPSDLSLPCHSAGCPRPAIAESTAGDFFLQVSHVFDASALVSGSSNGALNGGDPVAAAAATLAAFTERLREALRCDAALSSAAFYIAKQLRTGLEASSVEHYQEVPHGACTAACMAYIWT